MIWENNLLTSWKTSLITWGRWHLGGPYRESEQLGGTGHCLSFHVNPGVSTALSSTEGSTMSFPFGGDEDGRWSCQGCSPLSHNPGTFELNKNPWTWMGYSPKFFPSNLKWSKYTLRWCKSWNTGTRISLTTYFHFYGVWKGLPSCFYNLLLNPSKSQGSQFPCLLPHEREHPQTTLLLFLWINTPNQLTDFPLPHSLPLSKPCLLALKHCSLIT